MNKVAHYLQEHLVGEVVTTDDAREYFSTDSSIFKIVPSIITYPRNENDVRKTARFVWQLAERNRIIPLTPRGLGSNVTGSAISSGIIMVFPAHLNKIIELDSKTGSITTEAGANVDKLQQTLHTHGRFLPTVPIGQQYSSIGGAFSRNSSGDKSIKYGSIKNYAKRARIVLANGEVIETKRLSKRELSKKLGLSNFEGEIYRAIDTLLEENHKAIDSYSIDTSKNSAGYDIFSIRRKDKSFDLTPLFVGSEGTLGIVTELELETEPYNPKTTVLTAKIDDVNKMNELLKSLRSLSEEACMIEVIDKGLINFVAKTNPNQIKDVFMAPYPDFYLVMEFDDQADRKQAKSVKKAKSMFDKLNIEFSVSSEEEHRQNAKKVRELVSTFVGSQQNAKRALPVVTDAVVPPDQFIPLLQGIYELCSRHNISPAVWGQAGDANLSFAPILDIGKLGDRQKLFRLVDEYYKLVIELGGSISAEEGDGRLKTPYLESMYGQEIMQIFMKIKQIFDPYNVMNPGVKLNTTLEDIKTILRSDYSLDNKHNFLPRS